MGGEEKLHAEDVATEGVLMEVNGGGREGGREEGREEGREWEWEWERERR